MAPPGAPPLGGPLPAGADDEAEDDEDDDEDDAELVDDEVVELQALTEMSAVAATEAAKLRRSVEVIDQIPSGQVEYDVLRQKRRLEVLSVHALALAQFAAGGIPPSGNTEPENS